VFSSFIPVFAYDEGMDANSRAAFTASRVISCFPTILVDDGFGEREVVLYPDEYAGAYIDKFNRLHIVLTKDVDTDTEYDYRELTGYSENVVFEVATFSLSYLYKIQNALSEVMSDFDIATMSINEVKNRLEIGLLDLSRKKDVIAFLNNKFDEFNSKCLTFNRGRLVQSLIYTEEIAYQRFLNLLTMSVLTLMIVIAITALFLSHRKKKHSNRKGEIT